VFLQVEDLMEATPYQADDMILSLMIKTTLPLAIALCLTSTTSALLAEARDVEISSPDGFELAGTLWQEDGSEPGLLLLHQCNLDRSMYDDLGTDLSMAGFRVLAIDLRGLGASTDASYDLTRSSTEEDWSRAKAKFPEDVEAAYRFLGEQGEGTIVGALGASCGGNEVLTLAKAHSELRLLGFFSTKLSPVEIRDLLQTSGRLKLLITSKGDSAVQAAGTLAYRARSTSTLLLYEGSSHGYPLLEENPDLATKIVHWYQGSLDGLQ